MDTGRFEFRLDKADWERFPRADEWFLFDANLLFDSTASELAALEKGMGGYRIAIMLEEMRRGGAEALRAAYWIARRQAGVRESFAAFDPRVLAAELREADGGDADPPESSPDKSGPSSTDGQPDTSPPTSDQGSPATTPDLGLPTSGT